MYTKVFYELSLMECCGTPFKLVPAPGHSMLEPVPGTSEVIEAISSEDVEKYRGGLQAYGYVVELDEVSVNPAKHEY